MKKIIITIFIIIILDVIFVRSSNTNKINNDYYNLCKIELINEVDSYIKKFAPKSEMTGTNIVNLCLMYNFDIPLALSQFHIESHFASYGVAKRTNNVANVGNMDDGTILYKFNHPDESVEPYIKLMLKDYLNNKSIDELLNNFVNLHNKRYASDISYESKVKYKRNYIIKNTNILKLQNTINNLKISNKYELEH